MPETVSSSFSIGYAQQWPERLGAIREQYQDGAKLARSDTKTFSIFPDEYSEPDWNLVAETLRQADKAGKSLAVGESIRKAREIRAFLDENNKNFARRVTGHVNAQLKNIAEVCEYRGGAATALAIQDEANDIFEDQYRELNEAHRYLHANTDLLSSADTRVLESQIDTITTTSYFVFVDAILLRNELDHLLQEVDDVGETLDKAIAIEQDVASAPDASEKQVKAAREREEALKQVRNDVKGVEHNTRTQREGMDDDIVALRREYRTAFEKLMTALERRIEGES